ncbi:MAG TPA: flagellar FlbD family protein [Chloroflexi bacterium]|nr:flagellar FlbD family protein [Chloroflexota bacterium]
MIPVTRLNGVPIHVNAEMIVFVEATPDTVISLANGDRVVVRETPQSVVDAVIAYRRAIHNWQPQVGSADTSNDEPSRVPNPGARRA